MGDPGTHMCGSPAIILCHIPSFVSSPPLLGTPSTLSYSPLLPVFLQGTHARAGPLHTMPTGTGGVDRVIGSSLAWFTWVLPPMAHLTRPHTWLESLPS